MSSFKLCSSDSEFDGRISSVFGSLDSISNNLQRNPLPDSDSNSSKRKQNDDDDFKVPHIPTKYRRHLPGYVVHPDKWARYSMKDVDCSSDSDNKKIGIELMKQLRRSPENISTKEESDTPDTSKIFFRKPANLIGTIEEDAPEKLASGNSRGIQLPEYEVGKKKLKKKKNLSTSSDELKQSSQVALPHLHFQDDIEEENE